MLHMLTIHIICYYMWIYRFVCSHLFTCNKVAHTFSGCLSDLLMFLKHVVLNFWQSVLFHNLYSEKEMKHNNHS